jgi:hypothetical protein
MELGGDPDLMGHGLSFNGPPEMSQIELGSALAATKVS